jgi:hypothetical protein
MVRTLTGSLPLALGISWPLQFPLRITEKTQWAERIIGVDEFILVSRGMIIQGSSAK